ncbi:hypothetical protein [Achromobacter sp. AONIH1]|uniref:hypothetical protein n=1 Tax=Achromobacter sp. AONIH1 TaxID=1758194 RepID=UPI001319F216|nr:hypothetical protein [Achromobacter sp. AONIH1]
MIRRFVRTHGEALMNAAFCAVAIVFIALGYGERQQADESTLTAQDGGHKTAYAERSMP